METVNIVLFYGGIEANQPRDQLLEWLNSKELSTDLNCNLNARKTIDWPANSGSIVHERISQAVDQADLAIALFTPDDRCVHGSPNVIEEFGRWVSKKGPDTMATIRKEGVPAHTNAEGLIYIGYKENLLAESKNKILSFLKHQINCLKKNNHDVRSTGLNIQAEEKFVGREFVFAQINHFTKGNLSGYFSIIGHPGSGKSAILAKFIKSRDCLHYSINRASGNNTKLSFWRSVYLQAIHKYNLPLSSDSFINLNNWTGFQKLLIEFESQISIDNPLFIVIDAIDDIDLSDHVAGENILFLPKILPDHVFFIMARRPLISFPLNVYAAQGEIKLFEHNEENDKDAGKLISNILENDHAGIFQDIQQKKSFDENKFKIDLIEKSGGNFMYLKKMIQSFHLYKDLKQKLNFTHFDHSSTHWDKMIESESDEIFYNYKLPIIAILVDCDEPVSLELIQKSTGIKERSRIRGILNEWHPFLALSRVEGSTFYKLYNKNFANYLASLDIIRDAIFDLSVITQKKSPHFSK